MSRNAAQANSVAANVCVGLSHRLSSSSERSQNASRDQPYGLGVESRSAIAGAAAPAAQLPDSRWAHMPTSTTNAASIGSGARRKTIVCSSMPVSQLADAACAWKNQ